jgi:glycosyltransferase involved in cell wall biosynthesis
MNAGADVAIVVPSFRRPQLLERCLRGISASTVAPREIIVVIRAEDDATKAMLAGQPGTVTVVEVDETGVLAAMRAGALASHSAVVAFLDDDATPRPEWLGNLLGHFGDETVGGVGGRDEVDRPAQTGPPTSDVGRITRWGRVVGNHHLGTGAPRDVAVLKGANMAFRREALALPCGLRGGGAQVHFEVGSCLWARQRGWRLRYDADAVVDHTVGPRFDADRRGRPDTDAIADAAFNLVFLLGSFDPALAARRFVFGVLIGDTSTPGALRTLVALSRGQRAVLRRALPSAFGQARAIIALLQGRRVTMLEMR